MWPRLGPLPTYGILYFGSMLLYFVISWRIARRYELRRRVWIAAGVCYMLGMTFGAKLLFDLRHGGLDVTALFQAGHWTRGGMWGGLLAYFALAVPLVLLLSRRRRAALDLIALTIPIPWIAVKLGCLANGCCYGKPCALPWAITFPEPARFAPVGVPIHPTQLYEVALMVCALAVFAMVRADRWRGTKLMWFLILYGLGRAGTDFFRGDTEGHLLAGILSTTQVISLLGAAAAPLTLLLPRRRGIPAEPEIPVGDCDWHWSRQIMSVDFHGEAYEKASAHQKSWGLSLIRELKLRGNERILDLGCGDGILTAQLAMRVPGGRVLGIDASQGMLDRARRHEGGNLRFERQDINTLEYEDAFDLIFSNAALHWIADHRNMLERVYRALRNGGALRFNFAAEGNCPHLLAVVRSTMAIPAFQQQFEHFEWPWYMPSREEYEELLHASEFQECKVWLENADRSFPDLNAMIRWIDQPSLVPFRAHLREPYRRPFRNTVIDRMIRETRQQDGRYFETFKRINVFARKQSSADSSGR